MEQWNIIKERIALNSKEQWFDIYSKLKHDFSLSREYVESMAKNGNADIRNAALWHLDIINKYDVRQDYNNVVSIKLVIPSYCQAKCEFCFMNGYEKMEHDADAFLVKFMDSLYDIVNAIYGKQPISLDITGNEPTFNPNLLRKVLRTIKNSGIKEKINRIVMTTNGYRLNDVINDLYGVVDYVNISTHHFSLDKRRETFGTWRIPSDEELHNMILKLLDKGIYTSTVAVIYKPIDDFTDFVKNYIDWAKTIGFNSIRFRGDCATDKFASTFNSYIGEITKQYKVIQEEYTNDSHWCRLVTDDGYFFFMLQGVPSTYECSRGIEYIINDDGIAYLDYYKQHKFADNDLPMNYIFDIKK